MNAKDKIFIRRYDAKFMEATPLCLLLNKLHLFSLTQHRFIIIHIVPYTYVLHVSACT